MLIQIGSLLIGAGVLFSLLSSVYIAWRERERRAIWVSLALALVVPLPYLLVGLTTFALHSAVGLVLLGGTLLFALALVLPFGRSQAQDDTPTGRVDERDIMFSRWRLVPGTEAYEAYYASHPDKKVIDDRIRSAPGLLAPGAKAYHKLAFRVADASFAVIDALQTQVDLPPNNQPAAVDPLQMSQFVKGVTSHFGAASVGITSLRDYHIYTHIGRGAGTYGAPIQLDHRFAIAFTVEMDHGMMQHAPTGPATMETAKQYLSAAAVALELANLIRSLGYPARGHIDGNYRVICPLVARDAGLGEIGRMGLLMTPRHGPRVRIGVVTTDLPLVPDQRTHYPTMIDFCRRCRKCADNCPSRSIPFGDQQMIDGVLRWRIDSETCFLYWNTVGTDCGRCIAVCPYSHPDNPLHNLIRWGIGRSGAARRFALAMDDLLYGRKPAIQPWPDWMQPTSDH